MDLTDTTHDARYQRFVDTQATSIWTADRSAADELGEHKIRVNAVQPGLTQNGRNAGMLDDGPYTEIFKALTPLGPYGLPEQFAPMVTMLLSEESSWITGQVFAIDGGMTLRAYGGRLQAPA